MVCVMLQSNHPAGPVREGDYILHLEQAYYNHSPPKSSDKVCWASEFDIHWAGDRYHDICTPSHISLCSDIKLLN